MITRKQYPNHHVYEMEIGGRPFTVEVGRHRKETEHLFSGAT